MNFDDVLVINSYAGSLTLAARSLGLPIRGSYEDSAFGLHIQKKNFPNLNYVDELPWPRQDLRRTLVIAHPPCSAFSSQITANAKIHGHDPRRIGGTGSDAFQCTERVLKYSMEQNAAAVLVESVPGALEGARSVHDAYSATYGYSLVRILQNAASFGVPQWRERFWAVFLRDETSLRIQHGNELVTLRSALDPNDFEENDAPLQRQRARLRDYLIMNDDSIDRALVGPPYGKLKRCLNVNDPESVRMIFGPWDNSVFRVLDPDWFAPVIMPASYWLYNGRMLSRSNWKRIMGFPAEYNMPGADFKKYLTKGVCPPVAAWLLRNMMNGKEGDHVVNDGEVLDLRVDKKNVDKYIRHGETSSQQIIFEVEEDFLGEAPAEEEDFLGKPPKKIKMPAPLRSVFATKRSSGQRFRELIIKGASDQEALDVIRSEFPESRATVADAKWNRRELKVNADCYDERGYRTSPRPKNKAEESIEDFL